MKKLCSFIGCLVGLGMFLGSPLAAFAQETSGLQIMPPTIEAKVVEGQELREKFTATNLSSEEQEYFLRVRNIVGLTDSGTPIFQDDEEYSSDGLASWLVFLNDSVTIGAGQSQEVPFIARVPQNVQPGSHYASIFLSLEPEQSGETTGAAVGFQVGMILGLQIEGDTVEEMIIREFYPDKSTYGKNPQVLFQTRVENTGNILLRPRGPVEIFDMFGKKVETLTMNESGGGVLPGFERIFELEWAPEGFAFGKYNVLMSLVYGDELKKTITEEVSFWVLPKNIWIPGVIVILIFIALIGFVVKSMKRNARRSRRRPAPQRRKK